MNHEYILWSDVPGTRVVRYHDRSVVAPLDLFIAPHITKTKQLPLLFLFHFLRVDPPVASKETGVLARVHRFKRHFFTCAVPGERAPSE
jgi:hypothetical protein